MTLSQLISASLIAGIATLSPACAESNFSGAADQKKAAARDADAKGKGGVSDGDDSTDTLDASGKPNGVLTDDGSDVVGGSDDGKTTAPPPVIETIDGCGGGSKVADPEATYAFANASEMTALANAQGKYTAIPTTAWNAGAVHYDQGSADTICKLKGYLAGISLVKGRYSSCHDNTLGWWDEAQKNFIIHNACDDNSRLDRLTCKGKMKDICTTDLSWVFKKP